jgi:arylsulfatase A-like enzyme
MRSLIPLLFATAASAAVESPGRPNIVYIFTDQQTATAMGHLAPGRLATPGMDCLAREGVRFASTFCTYPLCTPSRASMFTGRMPHELGITGNVQGLPESGRQQEMGWIFRNAGYDTAYAGKWHLPKQTMTDDHGFEVIAPMGDERATIASIEYLRRPHDRPFLLVASLFQPHSCCVLHRYADPRDDDQLPWPADARTAEFIARCPPLPANFAPIAGVPTVVTALRELSKPADMIPPNMRRVWGDRQDYNAARAWTPEQHRAYLWGYDRWVERADACLARILDAIDAAGLTGKTLVVFSSDHGDMVSAHAMTAKVYLYEESVRVPLIMRLPGRIATGIVQDRSLVSIGLDLLPTLCDYAGIVPPTNLDGRSLRPLVEGTPTSAWREELVVQSGLELGDARLLRTATHSYMRYEGRMPVEELYDLRRDPGQLRNLADDPENRAILADCRARLWAWRERHGDHSVLDPASGAME